MTSRNTKRFLDRDLIYPYLVELSDCVGSGLWRLDKFRQACDECHKATLALDTLAQQNQMTQEAFHRKAMGNREVFDSLDAFCGAFARASLLLFPIRTRGFPQRRADTLQHYLSLSTSHPLADRDFRDSWMHFDERLDQAIQSGIGPQGQMFTTSRRITIESRANVLRLLEVDTGTLHYHDRSGIIRSKDVLGLRGAFTDIDAALKTSHRRLEDLPSEQVM